MSDRPRATRDPAFPIGPWVPAAVLPVAAALLGGGLSLLVLGGAWTWLGFGLAVLAAARPASAATWLLAALLVLGQLFRAPDAVGAELLLLVAGLHVLTVLLLHAAVLPRTARLELAALLRPARTVALIQVPAQLLAALVLVLSGRLTAVPAASAVGGALLVMVAATLALPLVRAEPAASQRG